MSLEEMKKKLMNSLSQERYQHSLGVMDESRRLAEHYRIDTGKAEIAGLLHDCAKYIDHEEGFRMLKQYGEEPDESLKRTPQLLHGPLGYYIAREHYGIKDKEILNAIYWHSTGKPGMTILEKIIFVADYTEVGRKFSGVEEARKTATQDLNRSILLCTDLTIRYVLSKGELLHPNTVETRNDAILNTMEFAQI